MQGGQGPGQRVVGPPGVVVTLTLFAATALLFMHLFVALWSPVVPTRLAASPDSAAAAGPAQRPAGSQGGADTSTTAPGTAAAIGADSVRAVPRVFVAADSIEAYCALVAVDPTSDVGCVRVLGILVPVSTAQRLLYLLFVSGALGSMVHVLRSLGWYVGNRLLTRSWIGYYAVLPFVGGVLGVVFYVVIRAGLFAPGATAEAESQFGFVAVAMLVGLFSQQAVLKLKEIADTLFVSPPKGADAAEAKDADSDDADADSDDADVDSAPPAPTVTGARREARADGAPADALVVVGAGFVPGCVLFVNGEKRAAALRSPTELVLTLTAEDLVRVEAGGDFHILVKDPDGRTSEVFDYA